MDAVVKSLEEASSKLSQLFSHNLVRSNSNKCHLLVSTNKTVNIKVEHFDIKNSDIEKLLGVKFDHKLTFNSHISEFCKKASKKVHKLARLTPHINTSKRFVIINAFFKSQFSYWPLVWMCHSRGNHSKINRLHERCLHIIYSGKASSFKALLENDGSVSFHNRKLHLLAIKMCKPSRGLSPPIITELFEKRVKISII